MILTVDLGTSATKATAWSSSGPLATGSAHLMTSHPRPGWAEQDAGDWWTSVVDACAAARDECAADAWRAIDAVTFASARETFVPVDAAGRPVGPAIVWSDRRAADEAAAADRDAIRRATGVIVDAGTAAMKEQWLRRRGADQLQAARWLLGPRDFVVHRMTGTVCTDPSAASRTGWYGLDGACIAPAETAALLPPVRASTDVAGLLQPEAGAALGLSSGVEVVVGAGDRQCEVLGTGSTPLAPMVSWGTTANLSVPAGAAPAGAWPAALSVGALSGYLLECGLSAAGAALEWLSDLTGRPAGSLAAAAAAVPPGAAGVVALPWLSGARAPWWERRAGGAFVGLAEGHGSAEMARALVEGVAYDVARCIDAVAGAAEALSGAGGGAAGDLWPSVLASVTSLPVVRRCRPDLAASAGACLVAAAAIGEAVDLDEINPVQDRVEPDAAGVEIYRRLRPGADRLAAAVIEHSAALEQSAGGGEERRGD